MNVNAMQTFDSDSGLAARLIGEQFPALRPVRAEVLGEGCDNRAFRVNGTWVFRFPKTPEVGERLGTEVRLLDALAAAEFPLAIPRVSFHGRDTAYPTDFMGYRTLPGVPAISLDPGEFPDAAWPALGRFLSVLHAFPVEEAVRCGVPEEPLADVVAAWGEEVRETLPVAAGLAPAAAGRWRAFLEAGPGSVPVGRRALLHNDLAAEHLLYDAGTRSLSGVIDWADAAIGDPAADLAGVLHWGGMPLLERVLAAYDGPADEATIACARWLAACRGAADVAFGLERDRAEYVAAGLRALRHCIDG